MTETGPAVLQNAPGASELDRVHAGDPASIQPRRPGPQKMGRRPKLSKAKQAALVAVVLSGQRTAAQMARAYGVSEPTVSRILAPHRVKASAQQVGERSRVEDTGAGQIMGVLSVAALDQRLAVVGTSGSGKTYATKGLVERLMDQGARVCIVDPLGVWWGLRFGPDGVTPASHPVVVFGGRHADVPLTSGMGAAKARRTGPRVGASWPPYPGSGAARAGFGRRQMPCSRP